MSKRTLIERLEALRDLLKEVRGGLSPSDAAAAIVKVFRSEMERHELGRPIVDAYKKGDMNVAVVTYPQKLVLRIAAKPVSDTLSLAATLGTAFSVEAVDTFTNQMRSRYGYTTRRVNRLDPDLATSVLPVQKQIRANLREINKQAMYIANTLLNYVIYS